MGKIKPQLSIGKQFKNPYAGKNDPPETKQLEVGENNCLYRDGEFVGQVAPLGRNRTLSPGMNQEWRRNGIGHVPTVYFNPEDSKQTTITVKLPSTFLAEPQLDSNSKLTYQKTGTNTFQFNLSQLKEGTETVQFRYVDETGQPFDDLDELEFAATNIDQTVFTRKISG